MVHAIRAAIAALALALLFGAVAPTAAAAERALLVPTPSSSLKSTSDPAVVRELTSLRLKAETSGAARIIIGLRVPFAPEAALGAAEAGLQRAEIASSQAAVIASVPSLRGKPSTLKQFETIPFMAMEVDASELDALASHPEVISIQEDRIADPTLAQSVPLIGGTTAWASGYTGSGQVVAVLDTGVDKAHSFLSGKVVSEACYSTAGSFSTSVCPGGVNSTASGSGVNCSLSVSGCDHGTHVAGIVAGTSVSFSGVAKSAGIIAVQVFSRFAAQADCGTSPAPCARTYSSDQILGLQRVYALRNTYSIAAVNMSLGGGQYFSACDASETARKAAIDNLRAVGIATVIASGNAGYTSSMGAPACISSAVSVGSTTKLDAVSSFSNSASFLHLLAPGSAINSSIPGGSFEEFYGTSMAAPHVAGAWAVLKQKKPTMTVSEGLTALASTGTSVTDYRNGIVKPRIQLDAALATFGGGGTLPSAPTIGTATAGNAQISVSFTPGALGTGSLINHTAECGAYSASGASSPIVVSVPNGSTYSCRVRTTTTVGAGPYSAYSNSVTPPGVPDDNFPPGATIPAGWTHPAGSTAPWVVASDQTYAGPLSLKSGMISHNQKSDISFTTVFSAGTVSFARKVSSELDFDYLQFYIDGVLQWEWSGEVGWAVASFPISAGSHTLLWRYVKDGSLSSGSDAAWIDSVSLPSALTVPTNVIATGGPASVTVSFTPGSLGGGSLVHHHVTCAGNTGPAFNAYGSASPITVTGLTTGVPYRCWVRTVTNLGTGAWSAASNYAAPTAGPPAAPLIGAVTPGAASITVGFTPGSLNGAPLTNHHATCQAASGPAFNGYGTASPITVRGLTGGVPYRCWVRSVTSLGNGGWSAASAWATPTNGPPTEPTIGSANPGPARVSVSFVPGSLSGGTLVHHHATCAAATGTSFDAYGSASPIVVNGLTAGVAYRCWVRTVTTYGTSPWSGASNYATPSNGPPAPPLMGTANAGPASISVSFVPGSLTGGSLVHHHATCIASSGPSYDAYGSSSPLVVSGLTSGVAYRCWVRTVSNYGTSAWSAASNYATPTNGPPPIPTMSSVTPGPASITVAFSQGTLLNGGTLVHHHATCAAATGPAYNGYAYNTMMGFPTQIVVEGLSSGVAYRCWVRTVTNLGTSAWSKASGWATPTNGPAGAPTMVSAMGGSAQLSVSYTPGSLNGGTLVHHHISCAPASGVGFNGYGSASPTKVTGLTPGTSYRCWVRTVTNLGTGAWSEPSNWAIPTP